MTRAYHIPSTTHTPAVRSGCAFQKLERVLFRDTKPVAGTSGTLPENAADVRPNTELKIDFGGCR